MEKNSLINITELEDKYGKAIRAIKEGNIYVGRFPDNVCIFVNNKGLNSNLKGIMYNHLAGSVTRFELKKEEFEKMYYDIFLKNACKHYKIEDNENDMIEHFDSIVKALVTM